MKSKTNIHRRLHVTRDPPKQEEAPFFDPCPRFQKHYGVKDSMDRILAYLYLREHHSDIKYSRTFSQKRICKYDSTMQKDGPSQAKFIKIAPSNYTTVNGWANVGGELKYHYDNGWKNNVDDICIDQQYEGQLQKHFQTKESELKHDYKAKIQYMNKYFKEIDDMYKVNDKRESVKKLRTIYKKSREELKPYVKYQGQRFFEILPLLKQRTHTVIDEFNCFKPLCNLQLQEKEKYLDDLFKHLNKKQEKEKEIKHTEPIIDYKDIEINQDPTIRRTYSTTDDLAAEAQTFNQNHYLFEVKDVNSFGQQIRMNKMHKIMSDMFKSQRNFQKDLKNYAQQHLHTSNSGDISSVNISQMQQSIQHDKQKELHRMHKSCQFATYRTNPKSPAMHSSAFQTTTTSNHFKF